MSFPPSGSAEATWMPDQQCRQSRPLDAKVILSACASAATSGATTAGSSGSRTRQSQPPWFGRKPPFTVMLPAAMSASTRGTRCFQLSAGNTARVSHAQTDALCRRQTRPAQRPDEDGGPQCAGATCGPSGMKRRPHSAGAEVASCVYSRHRSRTAFSRLCAQDGHLAHPIWAVLP